MRVRVGVIGLGEVAQIIHLPVLTALADRYEIVAVCDLSPTLLAAIGDRYRVPNRHADAAELVARPDLDAVLVLSNHEYHAEQAIAALAQGKHVLVEKPMCLNHAEAAAIIAARDAAGKHVMVGYMRRFAPAFLQAVEYVRALPRINYARVRDIIGQNRLYIEQTSQVLRPADLPPAVITGRAERAERLITAAIGEVGPARREAYALLLGLSSHDLSAMRELLGAPTAVLGANIWNGGRFITATFAYDGYCASFETGVDQQRRFDAHLEVYGDTVTYRVQYDSPYIRHLPTTLHISETVGAEQRETMIRPTFTDPYTLELEHFHAVVTGTATPKTTPEDFVADLDLIAAIMGALPPEAEEGARGAALAP